jgi:hypothetical protein
MAWIVMTRPRSSLNPVHGAPPANSQRSYKCLCVSDAVSPGRSLDGWVWVCGVGVVVDSPRACTHQRNARPCTHADSPSVLHVHSVYEPMATLSKLSSVHVRLSVCEGRDTRGNGCVS